MFGHIRSQRRLLLCSVFSLFGFLGSYFILRSVSSQDFGSFASFFSPLLASDALFPVLLFVLPWPFLILLFGISPFGVPFILCWDFFHGFFAGFAFFCIFNYLGFHFLILAFFVLCVFCVLLLSSEMFRVSTMLFSAARSACSRFPDLRSDLFRVFIFFVTAVSSAACFLLSCRVS